MHKTIVTIHNYNNNTHNDHSKFEIEESYLVNHQPQLVHIMSDKF
jgi:hypothetical protein